VKWSKDINEDVRWIKNVRCLNFDLVMWSHDNVLLEVLMRLSGIFVCMDRNLTSLYQYWIEEKYLKTQLLSYWSFFLYHCYYIIRWCHIRYWNWYWHGLNFGGNEMVLVCCCDNMWEVSRRDGMLPVRLLIGAL
jgi:hypothetical protein